MKNKQCVIAVVSIVLASAAHAQLYKSVGADGKVTYSDVPPPAAARVEKKTIVGGGNGPDLPYDLSQATGKHPVTFYTTTKCAPCDEGRKLLNERGVPFTEKTVTTAEDISRLQQIGGADGQLPVLTIGSAKQLGFEATAWNTALTGAGYPASSRLPRGYRNPPAEAAAPAVKTVSVREDAAPVADRKQARPPVNRAAPEDGAMPPQFRF